MDTKKLRQKILDLAIHGKLVPLDPNDEPASVLLDRIRAEKEQLIKEGKIKAPKKSKSAGDTFHYPKDVPFEVPEGWCWRYLSDIGTWQSGATPSRGVKAYFGGSIPWLKTGDLNDDYVKDIPERITDKALKETSVKLNPEGSVLIAMYGATIGKVGILTFPATTNQACCACSELCGVDNRFLFYFLISHKEEFIRQAGGGAQPNISKEIIVNTPIPVPPAEEQKRIVREIEKWLGLLKDIDKSSLFIHTGINDCKARILDLAIHGKLVPQDPSYEPAIELLKRINPDFKPSDNLHYDEALPSGWAITPLYIICDTINGLWKGKKEPLINVGVIRNANFTKDFTLDYSKIEYIDVEQKSFEKRNLENGDIIVEKSGGSDNFPVGRSILYRGENGKYSFSNFTMSLRIAKKDCILPEYLYYVLQYRYRRGDMKQLQTQTTGLHNLLTDKFMSLTIPIPPVEEQLRIVQTIKNLFGIVNGIRDLVNDNKQGINSL